MPCTTPPRLHPPPLALPAASLNPPTTFLHPPHCPSLHSPVPPAKPDLFLQPAPTHPHLPSPATLHSPSAPAPSKPTLFSRPIFCPALQPAPTHLHPLPEPSAPPCRPALPLLPCPAPTVPEMLFRVTSKTCMAVIVLKLAGMLPVMTFWLRRSTRSRLNSVTCSGIEPTRQQEGRHRMQSLQGYLS